MNPLRENFALRWDATSPLWRILLALGIFGVILSLWVPPATHPALPVAALRTICATVALVAAAVNKRVADEFYRRVYAEASVISLLLSAIAYIACSPFAFDAQFSAVTALSMLAGTWWFGFAIAFVRQSR